VLTASDDLLAGARMASFERALPVTRTAGLHQASRRQEYLLPFVEGGQSVISADSSLT